MPAAQKWQIMKITVENINAARGIEFCRFAKWVRRYRKLEFASGTNRADLSAPVYREPHFNNELLPRTTPRKRQAFIRGLADNRMRWFVSSTRGRQFVTMPDNKV